jgi:DNA replication protein DnaC
MLNHPTEDKLRELKLTGMLKALQEQRLTDSVEALTFEERLGLLVDREQTERDNRRMTTRLRAARLRQNACIEDLDWKAPRGLDRDLVLSLAGGRYLPKAHNILITGPTGVGKSYLACALAHKACRIGHTVLYQRLPRLLEEISLARADGRYPKLMSKIAKCQLLVLDDWGLTPMTAAGCRDLLEILEDRHNLHSTLITSQSPVEEWHNYLGDPTVADAILDRLIHNAYRLTMKGESMRKRRSRLDPINDLA